MKEKIRNGFDSIPQLEKDGTVHHLGIDHSQIGEGVILTSNLERVERIKDRFEDAKREAFHREYITYTGTYRDVRMSAMSIGNGCMPTEIAVEELRHIGCNRMIKVGSCYAIDGNLQKISNYIFIITPPSIEISGDFQEILSGAFDVPFENQY